MMMSSNFFKKERESLKLKMSGTTPNHLKIEPKSSNVIIGKGAATYMDGSLANSVIIGNYAAGEAVGLDLERNVYIGNFTGYSNQSGNYNTFVGSNSGVYAQTSHSIFLGYNSGLYEQEDNRLIINASSLTDQEPLIYGEFDNRWLKFDGGLALGNTNAGSTGNTGTQLLISGVHDEGVNAGSAEGTHKVKIEGYGNDGAKVYPLSMYDEDGNMDFFIENKNDSNAKPEMYFDGTMSIGGYDNYNHNFLALQSANSNWSTGLKMMHGTDAHGFTIESNDEIDLDGVYRSLLFKVHNNSEEGTIIGVANSDGDWSFGGTEIADGYKVSVNGKVACEEVMVDLRADWPDYVFQEDYHLKSLAEVEEHIATKGHLPGVPSAKKVKSDGLHLGDMNKILMEKVEELTLYIIEQNKTNSQQRNQIEEQNKRLESLEEKINSLLSEKK